MRGVETRIQEIRHRIFTEVARMAYHTEWPTDRRIEALPFDIMPGEVGNIRNRRKEFEKDIPAIYEMLRKGCEVARAAAADTLSDVRKAMKINYFDDAELINEQVKRFNK